MESNVNLEESQNLGEPKRRNGGLEIIALQLQ